MSDCAALLPDLAALVREAGSVAQEARSKPERVLKADGSIQTNGDRLVEEFLRPRLEGLVRGSTVWGEEFGYSEEGKGGLWLVDPVDGTSNYAFGSPLWGVSVGLAKGDDILLGAVILPDLGELYLSSKGGGVSLNGITLSRIEPGPIKPFELVSYSDRVLKVAAPWPGKMRHAGAFVIDGCFVASQRYRGLVGIRERFYDIAACMLFGMELGADVRYADGSAMSIAELKENKKIDRPWLIFPRDSGFTLSANA